MMYVLGFMSFFTKAVVAALKKYPYVNSEIDGDEILLKNFMISESQYQLTADSLFQTL